MKKIVGILSVILFSYSRVEAISANETININPRCAIERLDVSGYYHNVNLNYPCNILRTSDTNKIVVIEMSGLYFFLLSDNNNFVSVLLNKSKRLFFAKNSVRLPNLLTENFISNNIEPYKWFYGSFDDILSKEQIKKTKLGEYDFKLYFIENINHLFSNDVNIR